MAICAAGRARWRVWGLFAVVPLLGLLRLPAEAAPSVASAASIASAASVASVASAASDTTGASPDTASGADPQRGRAIAFSRSTGLCILCHTLPGAAAHEASTIGPELAGVASRLDRPTLRQRLVAPQSFNPHTVMPAYGPVPHHGARVAAARQGQPLLDERALADVLAYLETLK